MTTSSTTSPDSAAPSGDRLDRIERKQDELLRLMGRLLDYLADDGEEPEGVTLDGIPAGAERQTDIPL